jgi:hypothetical protein
MTRSLCRRTERNAMAETPSVEYTAPPDSQPQRYGLVCAYIGSKSVLEISQQAHQQVTRDKEILREAILFEQKFDLVVANHLDLEKTLNNLAAETMIHQDQGYLDFQNAMLLINQQVNNLLSACRGYLDQADQHVGVLANLLGGIPIPFGSERSRFYDSNPHYALAETLRNHSQHRGFAVSSVTFGGHRIENEDSSSVVRHAVQAFIDVEALLENPKTKATVVDWLKASPEKIDVRPILRDYVAALAAIHETVRKAIEAGVVKAEGFLQSLIDDFRRAFPTEQGLVALAEVHLNSNGTYDKKNYINENFLSLRRKLAARNRSLQHVVHWHVSSEPRARTSRKKKT